MTDPAPSDSGARPSAEGTFGRTPFAHVLLYAHARGLTGTVELDATFDGESAEPVRVLLVEGKLAKVVAPGLGPRLGEVVAERFGVPLDAIEEAYAWRDGRSLGASLVAAKVVTAAELEDALAVQLERKLMCLFDLGDDTRFAYWNGTDRVAGVGGDELSSLDPFPLIWHGLKHAPPWEHVHGTLARVGGFGLRLTPAAQTTRFGFGDEETAVVRALDGNALRIHDVLRLGVLPASATQLVLYALVVTKQLEVIELPPSARGTVSSPPPPPAAPVEPVSAVGPPSSQSTLGRLALEQRVVPVAAGVAVETRVPSSVRDPRAATPMPELSGLVSTPADDPGPAGELSPDPARRRVQIISRASASVEEDLYAILGLARTATATEIEAAFLDRMKRWHPDRLPTELADVRGVATRLVSRITEARATLADAAKRKAYDEALARGSTARDEEAQVERVLRAASDFQKAQVHLKRNDLAACEALARAAWEADPTQADYLALVVWTESQRSEAQRPAVLTELIARLDKAVALGERCERAYFYRGMLLKRAGQLPRAMADFRKSAELDPRNLDALREVRLYNLRGGRASDPPPSRQSTPPSRGAGKSPPPPAGSLLGRIFKR